LVFALALASTGIMAEESSFKRERRTLESATEALATLRETLADQKNSVFVASAALRNTARKADVIALSDNVDYLAIKVADFASADAVDSMADAVRGAITASHSAAVLTNQIADTLPPLRSRSEVALDTSLSLLQRFASHEESVAMFESITSAPIAAYYSAVDEANMAKDYFLESSNFTAQSEDLTARADAIISFVEAIDTDAYSTVLSRAQMTSLYSTSVPVFRYRVFSTYSQRHGWHAGNSNTFYGGVAPSTWSDGNGYAYQMSRDLDVLRTLYTHRLVGGFNANVWAQEWYYYSSTNSIHTTTLFRIKNKTNSPVSWSVYFYFYIYASWSEAASMSVNGDNVWTYTGNCYPCTRGQTVTIPARATSTIIIVVPSGHPSNTRTAMLAFYNNSLRLPSGLEWVDDLPVASNLLEFEQ
jgi:hypothetical protein